MRLRHLRPARMSALPGTLRSLCAALVAGFLAAPPAAAQSGPFSPTAAYPGAGGPQLLGSVSLTDTGTPLLDVLGLGGGSRPVLSWADVDGDGDLDLLSLGGTTTSLTSATSTFYRNDGGTLTDVATAIPALTGAAAAWGDYDGDGDLDLVVSGVTTGSTRLTQLLRNDAGTLVPVTSGLPDVQTGSLTWADVDNDGDLDLLVTGNGASGPVSEIYLNNGGSFSAGGFGLEGLTAGSAAFADFDRDGYQDLVVCGLNVGNVRKTDVYRNNGGSFTLIANLVGVSGGTVATGDLNGDGVPDIALCGVVASTGAAGGVTKIYLANAAGTSFTDAGAPVYGGFTGALALGDYDQDGDPDFVVAGENLAGAPKTYAVRNDGGTFVTEDSTLIAIDFGAVAWGDYDGDRRLDLVETGGRLSGSSVGAPFAALYHNTTAATNAVPSAPGGLSTSMQPGPKGVRVTFSWTAASDDHTPAVDLTYQLRVGRTPGGSEVTGAVANPATGFRRVVQSGNTGTRTSWSLDLPVGTYYWSVQAVDASYQGGPFAAEKIAKASPFAAAAALLPVGSGGGGFHTSTTWADYDRDGRLDLLVMGDSVGSLGPRVQLYHNVAGSLVPVTSSIPALLNPTAAWGDYDNDGWPDLVVAGATSTGRTTQLLHNVNGVLTPVTSGLPDASNCALVWADVNNDGQIDLLVSGVAPSLTSKIYLNHGGTFTNAGYALEGMQFSQAAFADFDRDGDLDLVLNGFNASSVRKTHIYRNDNDGASFTLIADLDGVSGGNVSVGDLNEDGVPDIVLSGTTGNGQLGGLTKVYFTNATGTAWTDASAGLTGGYGGSSALGDFDGDGDLDLALGGVDSGGNAYLRFVRNDAGTFTIADSSRSATGFGSIAFGDVDGDGRLDVVVAGSEGQSNTTPATQLYLGVAGPANAPPAAPVVSNVAWDGSKLTVTWNVPADDHTPGYRLTYDAMLGTTVQGGEILQAPALVPSGTRTIPRAGTIDEISSWHVDGVPAGVYYMRVQAVDASMAGSPLDGWYGFTVGVTGVGDPRPASSGRLQLLPPSPNPCMGAARVDFDLPHTANVDLAVYDVAGRRVRTLLRDRMAKGREVALWDGATDDGRRAPAGVYFVHLVADGQAAAAQRLVVTR